MLLIKLNVGRRVVFELEITWRSVYARIGRRDAFWSRADGLVTGPAGR